MAVPMVDVPTYLLSYILFNIISKKIDCVQVFGSRDYVVARSTTLRVFFFTALQSGQLNCTNVAFASLFTSYLISSNGGV